MQTIIYPTYFPSISHYIIMANANTVTFEIEDNFQKQTNRNRMYIYSPNGIQLLNVPVKHANINNQKTKDVKIETAFDWQKQHFKSLEAAYRASPFFEYYEDIIYSVFAKKHTFLLDLNFETMEVINKCLGLTITPIKTTEYFHELPEYTDFRNLANGKKDTTIIQPYPQVFQDKKGFINNLSILDLLFNEGRYALSYLQQQQIPSKIASLL